MGNSSCSCSLEEGNTIASPERQIAASPLGYTRATIHRWDFNVLDLAEAQLHQVAFWLLEHKRGDNVTGDDKQRLSAFTQQVFKGYLPNPYHNVFHAVDVMHAVFLYGELVPWHDLFPVQMQYALLVGALSHDIGHFGLTNAFLVDMRDGLAIQYNDISPLENMHCSKLYAILQEERTNVFDHFSLQDYKELRKMVIDSILHTDMSHHGEMVKDLKDLGSSLPAALDIISKEQIEVLSTGPNKTLIARVLLHGADLSNPAKPWNIAHSWAQNVLAEFFAQGDKEKALGLPVGMLNDRDKVNLPNSQIGFTQFVVAPFLACCTKVFGAWRKIASQLGANTQAWGKMWCADMGKDEDERVHKVLIALGLREEPEKEIVASTGGTDGKEAALEKIADSPAKPLESTGASRDWSRPSSLPALTNGPTGQSYPRAAHAVVRELRRWREDKDLSDTKRHRELVLLYVLSDGDIVAAEGKEILLKYNTRNTHFSEPTPLEDEPKVVTVAVAADNMCSYLDRDSFDHLLTALLEKRATY